MEKKMTRNDIKKERNRAALIDAGKKLFAEQGFQNTKIKDITDYCNIGYGTFYLYFNSKEVLMEAIVDEMAQNLVEYKSVRELKGLTIRERMYHGTKDILQFVVDNKMIFKIICDLSQTDAENTYILESIWSKIRDRMFYDHNYFKNKGYSKEDIVIGSTSWQIYNWTLEGIIGGIVSSDISEEDIDKLSRIYADMNYYTFIKEEVQMQDK